MQTFKVTYSNGEEKTYEIYNADRVRYDLTRAKHKWPTLEEAPILAMTFWAWAAAKRNGYEGTWEEFSEYDALNVEPENEEGEESAMTP